MKAYNFVLFVVLEGEYSGFDICMMLAIGFLVDALYEIKEVSLYS